MARCEISGGTLSADVLAVAVRPVVGVPVRAEAAEHAEADLGAAAVQLPTRPGASWQPAAASVTSRGVVGSEGLRELDCGGGPLLGQRMPELLLPESGRRPSIPEGGL